VQDAIVHVLYILDSARLEMRICGY